MRKTLYILPFVFILSIQQQLFAGEKGTRIEPAIDSVKLSLTAAEIYRSQKIALSPGRNAFIIAGLSSKLYSQSVQISTESENIRILSITTKTNFLEKTSEDERITELNDSVEIVRIKIADLRDEKTAYEEEKAMLIENRMFKGSDKTVSVAELETTANFFRKRNLEISKAITKLDRGITELNRKLFDMKLQLRELNAGQIPTAEIHLVLEADQLTETNMVIRYVVSDAGWAAIYDLESVGLGDSIELGYRGLAYNNTGIDWKNVSLTLMTGDPLQGATQPELMVWNLDNYSSASITDIANLDLNVGISMNNYANVNLYNSMEMDISARQQEVQQILGDDWDERIDYETDLYRRYRADKLNAPHANVASIDVPETNIEFRIPKPYSVPSDKRPYSVNIVQYKLPVTYKYYAVPKLDKDAFLLAQIVGWEDLDLISGPVNIYKGKKYVGQSELNIRNLNDTLAVSLGRDENVVITRVKIKGKSRRQVLGTLKKASVAYNISVRNNHNQPINIQIQDQVPVSSDKEVIITVDESSGAEIEEKIGVLTWDMTVEAGETQTREFGFSIKYPKDKTVHIQYKQSKSMQQSRYF